MELRVFRRRLMQQVSQHPIEKSPGDAATPQPENGSRVSSITDTSLSVRNAKTRPPVSSQSDDLREASPVRRTTAVPSSVHIRRRVPSLQGRAPSPLFARPAVTTIKKETVEHRTDPSPAPSRPPRTVKRHSILSSPPLLSLNSGSLPRGLAEPHLKRRTTGYFQNTSDKRKSSMIRRPSHDSKMGSLGSAASIPPSSVSGLQSPPRGVRTLVAWRRSFVPYVKPTSQVRSGVRQGLEALPSQDRGTRDDVVRQYKSFCESIGQAPNETWVAAVLKGRDNNSLAGSRTRSDMVSPGDSKLRPLNSSNTIMHNRENRVSETQEKTGNSFHALTKARPAKDAMQRRSSPKRSGSAPSKTPTLSGAAGATREYIEGDGVLDHMVKYCRRLQFYIDKIGMLKKQRLKVREALENFLKLLRRIQHHTGNGESRLSTIINLELHASSLTDGLKELQRCSAELLRTLSNYSREMRRPLGVVSSKLEFNTYDQLLESAKDPSKASTPLSLFPSATGVTPLGLPSLIEPPVGYLKALCTEEKCIVQELNSVCLRVHEALLNAPCVYIADGAMLDTPLFVPSPFLSSIPAVGGEGVSTHSVHVDVEQKFQISVDAQNRFPKSDVAQFSEGIVPIPNFASVRNGQGHTVQNASNGKSVNACVKNEGGSRHFVGDPRSTAAFECIDTKKSEAYTPFVGVGLTGWGAPNGGEEEEENKSNSSYGFRRCSSGNPQLVLGGGQRCLLISSDTTKRSSVAEGDLSVSRGKSVSAVARTKKTFESIAKSLPVLSRPKCNTGRKPYGVSNSKNSVTSTQIKKALETWLVIQNMTTTDGEDSTKGSEHHENKSFVSDKNIDLVHATTIWNTEYDQKEHPTGASPKIKSISSQAVRKGNGVKLCVTRLSSKASGGERDESALGENGERNALPLTSNTGSKSQAKKDAVDVITRFLRAHVWRKSFLENKNERKTLQYKDGEASQLYQSKFFFQVSEVHMSMATRIACCWRQYVARRNLRQRQAQAQMAQQQYQRWNYENLMVCRLQRFFAVLLARRKAREVIQMNRRIRSAASNESVITVPVSATGSQKENNIHVSATRERFNRARERRKILLRTHLEDKLTSFSSLEDASNKTASTMEMTEKRQQNKRASGAATMQIPPLNLKSTNISTFSIENYNSEVESFKVDVLHRLLHASRALLYALRVMCDSCETQPDSASEILAANEKVDPKSRSEAKLKKLKDGEKPQTHDADRATVLFNKNRNVKEFQDMGDVCGRLRGHHCDEVQWEIRPYLAINRHLFLRKLAMGNDPDMALACLLSIRADGALVEDELSVEDPVERPFQRPFEVWGIAHAFQCRAFTAAALYAWKLIFSHTPHDDYKQRMLKTEEEREARLERVEQRNRMILACYCVRSEREWLKEASMDIGFVARIWNPKRSLDPNDPEFERHCRETYEFVEDFLYQCFPTVVSLDEVPAFLMGAGIFFVLNSVLANTPAEVCSSNSVEKRLLCDYTVPNLTMKPLDAQQRRVVFIHELLNLIDTLSRWERPEKREKDTEACKPVDTTNKSRTDNYNNDNSNHTNSDDGVDTIERHLERTSCPSAGKTHLDINAQALCTFSATTEDEELSGVKLPRVQIMQAFSSSSREAESPLLLVYPKGYLLKLSERLTRALFGLELDLEVCEDLDTMI